MLSFYLSILTTDDEKWKFEQLYLTYRALMKYEADGIIHDECLAEDATHDAFVNIIGCMDKFDDDIESRDTKSLIVLMIREAALSMINKHQCEKDFIYESEPIFTELDANRAADAVEIVDKIKNMPEPLRDVLILRYVHGYNEREIARMLNIKFDASRARLKRAKRMLLLILRREGNYNA